MSKVACNLFEKLYNSSSSKGMKQVFRENNKHDRPLHIVINTRARRSVSTKLSDLNGDREVRQGED
jgi:molybdopterin-guanine dinucleotide biosynthesis protein A